MWFSVFNQPYPYDKSPLRQLQEATILGVFTTLILLFFQPFGLSGITQYKELIILGYGVVGWVASVVLRLLMQALLPKFHKPSTWTVGKAILKNLHEIFWIGIAIFLYSSLLLGYASFSWRSLYYFQLYSFMIAPIPTVLIVWLKQKRLERLYTKSARQLNLKLLEKNQLSATSLLSNNGHLGQINAKVVDYQGFSIHLEDVLFVQITRQEAKFYQEKNEKLEKTAVPTPNLKLLHSLFKNQTFMFRAHPNYWVNLQKVKLITGNSGGFKLIFDYISESIPVAGSQIQRLRKQLQ
jgi:LytTr DNA-binding domain